VIKTICLTPDEAEALSEVLAMLAVIDDRANSHPQRLVTISRETWRDMLLRPAQRLLRVRLAALEDR
jgi:hypothetical protein